ncbi:MAG: NAD(P)H-dependent oxidoreductase [Nakamurella sp.]
MSAPVLQIIIGSTRPGRIGPALAAWFAEKAREHGDFEVEVLDLADFGLPLFDEPHHPMQRRYTQPHTKAWSAAVDRGDAVVFVHPEYNHSVNGALKNAIDFLHGEWAHKPVSFVSYGGASGGLRAVQALKPVVSALRMYPTVAAVALAGPHRQIEDGTFVGTADQDRAAATLLDELWALAAAVSPLLDKARAA